MFEFRRENSIILIFFFLNFWMFFVRKIGFSDFFNFEKKINFCGKIPFFILQITEPVAHLSEIMRSFFDCDTIPPEPNIFSPGFLPDRTNKYIVKSHSNEFNNNQRSQVVWSILNRTRYKNECPEKVGIQRLIAKQVWKLIQKYGVWKSQKKSHSTLRAKLRLHFEWTKVH